MPSKHYRNMGRQLRRLERLYLNFPQSPLGKYSEEQLSLAAAYTVFAHAEIESFIEAWAQGIIDKVESNFKLKKRYSRVLAHLVTFHEKSTVPSQAPKNDIWAEPIFESISLHRKAINRNHGIKEEHICKVLVPLGFDVRSINQILLGDLATFAKIRGDHAHQSSKIHLRQVFDPFDRKNKVSNIYTLLASLDQDLTAFVMTA